MRLRYKDNCTNEDCLIQGISIPGQLLIPGCDSTKKIKLVFISNFNDLDLFGEFTLTLDCDEANNLAYRIFRATGELTHDDFYKGFKK